MKTQPTEIWVDDSQGLLCGTNESLERLRDHLSTLLTNNHSKIEFSDHDYTEHFIHRIQIFESHEAWANEEESSDSSTWGEKLLILFVLSIPIFALIGILFTLTHLLKLFISWLLNPKPPTA